MIREFWNKIIYLPEKILYKHLEKMDEMIPINEQMKIEENKDKQGLLWLKILKVMSGIYIEKVQIKDSNNDIVDYKGSIIEFVENLDVNEIKELWEILKSFQQKIKEESVQKKN